MLQFEEERTSPPPYLGADQWWSGEGEHEETGSTYWVKVDLYVCAVTEERMEKTVAVVKCMLK